MVRENLTKTFESADSENAVADNINAAPPPATEQVAVNWHGVLTRMLSISPESAAGICNAVGQASCLLSSTKIPEDSLRGQFRMSADDVRGVANVMPDNIDRPRRDSVPEQHRTFG